MYYFYEKYYKPITAQYYITNGVSWLPRLTLLDLNEQKLDLQIHSWNGTHSYVGDLLYKGIKAAAWLLFSHSLPLLLKKI